MTSRIPARLHNLFGTMGRALAYRDYRLLFSAQCISQLGTWMQQMTVVWLAYKLTDSAVLVGVVGFCSQFPTFILAPLAGVWSDRFDRRRILLVTQALAMLQAFTLAALTLTGLLDVWTLTLLVAVLGVVSAFDMTAAQAFVKNLVRERADLGSAIALNSSVVNAARLIGPALAGVLIHYSNEGFCFLVNGLSFLATLAALAAVSPAPVKEVNAVAPSRLGQSLREGLRYALGNRPIRDLLLLLAVLAMFGMPYTLLPVLARDVLHGGPNALGLLMGASGLGAMFATLGVAARRRVIGAESSLVRAGLVLAAALALIGATDMLWFAVLCRLVAGFCVLLQTTLVSTMIQTLVDDDYRGRVSSFSTMAILGALPLGNLVAGALAGDRVIGVTGAFLLSGVCCLAGVVWFGLRLAGFRQAVQPVYERLGLAGSAAAPIVPETGLDTVHQ